MKTTAQSLLVALLIWLGPGMQAAIAGELAAPQQVIRETSTRLYRLLEENRDRLQEDPAYLYRLADEVLVPHLDLERISRLVLGRYWHVASVPQKQAFQKEFKQLMLRTYATALREIRADWEIRFLPLTLGPKGKRALVKTQIVRDGTPPLAVDYSMVDKAGHWLAYDVRIEGMSLVTNYRASFSRLIRSRGIGGLIEEMAVKNSGNASAAERRDAVSSNGT